jgi:hypothetical protein
MKGYLSLVSSARTAFVLGLALLAPGGARAANTYKVQPIVKLGDTLGDTLLKAGVDFEVDTLNDAGQLLFVTYTPKMYSEMLFQYVAGKITPLIVPDGDAPGGKWPKSVNIVSPASGNQSGNVVMAVSDNVLGIWMGTFLWDYQAQKMSQVLSSGMPAVNNLIIGQPADGIPAINNNGEMSLVAEVKDASLKSLGDAVFFLGHDGKLVPVALPGQALPDGGTIRHAFYTSINDAGRIAFLAVREENGPASAYVWDKGTITPVAQNGTNAPSGDKIFNVGGVWVNNKNGNILVELNTKSSYGPYGLYLFADGKLTPVAVPGQDMPDGGKFMTLPYHSVGFPNDRGEYPFFAFLNTGGTGAYMVGEDGKLSLILKYGTSTELGPVTSVGLGAGNSFGIAMNNNGQVALVIKVKGIPAMLAMLTPAAQ